MYRVELKVEYQQNNSGQKTVVPNVPCGVESTKFLCFVWCGIIVPNVPCGVESGLQLKKSNLPPLVPNVPCGVERSLSIISLKHLEKFLMYRVELKVFSGSFSGNFYNCS